MPTTRLDEMRGCEFWREGCGTTAAAICSLLRMAGEPVTPLSVARLAESLPRSKYDVYPGGGWALWSYCGECVRAAGARQAGAATRAELDCVCDHLLRHFPGRAPHAKEGVIDSIVGVLRGCEFDEPRKGVPGG